MNVIRFIEFGIVGFYLLLAMWIVWCALSPDEDEIRRKADAEIEQVKSRFESRLKDRR